MKENDVVETRFAQQHFSEDQMPEPLITDWINSVSAAVGALAVVIGLFGAKNSIDANRKSARDLRRSQVAEELIAAALNVEDAFRGIRTQIESIPKEKIGDVGYAYQKRYDRLLSFNDLFKELRDAQVRVQALIGDDAADAAVEELFKARNKVRIAIEILAKMSSDNNSEMDSGEPDPRRELRSDLFGNFGENDDLGKKVMASVQTIQKRMNPIARLDEMS